MLRIVETIRLLNNNIRAKFSDHLMIGSEHGRKITDDSILDTPSKIEVKADKLPDDEKIEIVLNDPKFGMFSLFKYHITRGYLNTELKSNNVFYCSHIFSLYAALPILVFLSQWMMYIALISNEHQHFDGNLCPNSSKWYHKLLMSGVSMIYFVKSFYIWDNLTKRIKLYKIYPFLDIWVMLDTFQEFIFNILVYGANIWIVFVESDIQNMILNSVAMEFLMQLDNEFQEYYFKLLPDAAIDIYDNVFVSAQENLILIEEKEQLSKCFKFLLYFTHIPFKLMILSLIMFPVLCLFMIVYGPICK